MMAWPSLILSGRRSSGSKGLSHSRCLMNVRSAASEELVDPRSLTWHRPQQSTDALDVLSLPEPARHDDRSLGIGNVESLIQHLSRNERP